MRAYDESGPVPTVDFDFDAIDEAEEASEAPQASPTAEDPERVAAALCLVNDVIRWAGGIPERCSLIMKLVYPEMDPRTVCEIARDSRLNRHKVRRAHDSGLRTVAALRAARKRTLINKGPEGVLRADVG